MLKMTTTETPFLQQVRLARCEALARELATLRAKLPFALGDQQIYKTACEAVEADLVRAAGTPQQRALEAAIGEVEGQLTDALLEGTTRQGTDAGVRLARQRLCNLQKWQDPKIVWPPNDYTGEAEDTLTRLRSLAASLHTDPELQNLSGEQVLAKLMEALSPGAL